MDDQSMTDKAVYEILLTKYYWTIIYYCEVNQTNKFGPLQIRRNTLHNAQRSWWDYVKPESAHS